MKGRVPQLIEPDDQAGERKAEPRSRKRDSSASWPGRARAGYLLRVQPTAEGLPNRFVLLIFPALLLIVMAVLVTLGVTGSSTGMLNNYFSSSADPALIAGQPQSIRSDEWLVQTAATVSQVEQGLPSRNGTLPGGIDSTVQSDMPGWDAANAFRPHLWSFWFLPLDQAMAWKWWLPGFALMGAAYVFIVTMIPRRPVAAAMLSVGFFFAPFFQWWYLPITFYPVVWAFVVMTAVVWLKRSNKLAPRIILPTLAGYLTVTTGMSLYVPFIIPSAYVAGAFTVATMVGGTPRRNRIRGIWLRFWPILLAGLFAGIAIGVWIATRLDTIRAMLGTVYPGQRFQEPGGVTLQSGLDLFGATFTTGIGSLGTTFLGDNASETSTYFLVGVFLLIPLVWYLVDRWRRVKQVDWTIVALLGVLALFAAFMAIPGWDGLARILLLDRVPSSRFRIGIGLASLVAIVVLVRRFDQTGRKPPWSVAIAGLGAAIVVNVSLLTALIYTSSPVIASAVHWKWVLIGLLLAVMLFGRLYVTAGAAVLLAISLIGSAGVNPLYHGVYNLNETDVGRAVHQLEDEHPGSWVGVGGLVLSTSVLVQTGVEAYNGLQPSPPALMWENIDPAKTYEQVWNRLANVYWVAGVGDPKPSNPGRDQILLTFDSCAVFAQEHVANVLSSDKLNQDCLDPVATVPQGPGTFYLYEVKKRS